MIIELELDDKEFDNEVIRLLQPDNPEPDIDCFTDIEQWPSGKWAWVDCRERICILYVADSQEELEEQELANTKWIAEWRDKLPR